MRHGIGSKAQHGALLEAGVDRVWSPAQVVSVLSEKDVAFVAFRPYDTIVMIQPKILNADVMRQLSRLTPSFEVVGHSPIDASRTGELSTLRGLSPMDNVAVEPRKGGNLKYKQPTPAQVKTIVDYWHGPKKPAEFMPDVREMMGEPDLPNSWARDVVIKHTGNSKRDPNAPGKRPLNLQDE